MIFRNSGIFYETFDNDSYIMHYLFSYKISKTGKVGFPISAKNKVINVLDSKKINYTFIEPNGDNLIKDFKGNNKYDIILNKALAIIDKEKMVNDIKDEINKLDENKLKELFTLIKDFVYEKWFSNN